MIQLGKLLWGCGSEVHRCFAIFNERSVNIGGPGHQLLKNLGVTRGCRGTHESLCTVATKTIRKELLKTVSSSGHLTELFIIYFIRIMALLLFDSEPLLKKICDKLPAHLQAVELHFRRKRRSLSGRRLSEFSDDASTGSTSIALKPMSAMIRCIPNLYVPRWSG
jgi:hypothetical protein